MLIMKIVKYTQVWELWEDYQKAVYHYLLKRTKDKNEAEDLTQEVLLKIHQSCCSDTEIKNQKSWTFQIAHNTLIDYYKNQSSTKKLEELPFENEEINTDEIQKLAEYTASLIECLPEKYAIPLKMADIDNIKQEEIAQKLNLGLSATKSRIQRARVKLKEQILECFQVNLDAHGNPTEIQLKSTCNGLEKNIEKSCVFSEGEQSC